MQEGGEDPGAAFLGGVGENGDADAFEILADLDGDGEGDKLPI